MGVLSWNILRHKTFARCFSVCRYPPPEPMIRFDIRFRLLVALLLLGCLTPVTMWAEESTGVRLLHSRMAAALASLPAQTHLLLEQQSIEQFLVELDGAPPDWATVYGQGHHDPGHDDSLRSTASAMPGVKGRHRYSG
jgi:hypothetical protein